MTTKLYADTHVACILFADRRPQCLLQSTMQCSTEPLLYTMSQISRRGYGGVHRPWWCAQDIRCSNLHWLSLHWLSRMLSKPTRPDPWRPPHKHSQLNNSKAHTAQQGTLQAPCRRQHALCNMNCATQKAKPQVASNQGWKLLTHSPCSSLQRWQKQRHKVCTACKTLHGCCCVFECAVPQPLACLLLQRNNPIHPGSYQGPSSAAR